MDHTHFFYSCLFLLNNILRFSDAIDILYPNQTLDDGEGLISPNQMFELGFFSPGESNTRFLGIWYRAAPHVFAWVANRNNPIMINSGGVLTLTENGTLMVTTTQGAQIWSSNLSRPASSPALQLLDTGNLVLVENATNIWQSYDYPGDTRTPGMLMVQDPDSGVSKYLTSWKSADDPSTGQFSYRIENDGLSQVVMMEGTKKMYRCPFWNGYIPGFPISTDQAWTNGFVTRGGKLISMFNPIYGSTHTRLTMNYSGLLQRYKMNDQKDGWNLMTEWPRFSCERYGWCGNNTICYINRTPECECLRGFKPKTEAEWGIFVWKSGCQRNLPIDCQNGNDSFLKLEGIKFPDSLHFVLNTSMSIQECRDECLRSCNCTAYGDPYSNNGTRCLMWFGDLIDMRDQYGFVDPNEKPTVYIRVPVAELEKVTDWKQKREGTAKKKILIAAASGFGILILSLSFGGLLLRMRRKRQADKKTREEFELPLFGLATIAAATNNFATENLIGRGGFGPVYKGNLSAEQTIAVKRMSRTSGQGVHEFKNELTLIAKLQHRNLVRILGCCIEGEEKMLIYEYMQNKSLDYFVFDKNRSAELNWPKRFDIIMGIARGLLYLHHDSRLKIIHRDLKTSNVLLDENLNAKISDFGLARMFEGDEQTSATTKRVVGTYGYMAPEYAFGGQFSIKSDVFSMGVVILEIVSGQKNRAFQYPSLCYTLLEQAWLLWNEDRALELMDPCYDNSQVESQVKRCIQVGLLCVQSKEDERPPMSSVLPMLSTDDAALPQPQKPIFLLQTSPTVLQRDAAGSKKSSKCSITVSDVEGR